MFLQRLVEYSRRLSALPPPSYIRASVRYHISLDSQGHLLSCIDTADAQDPRKRRGEQRDVPWVQHTSKPQPMLLAHDSEYTLGLVVKDEERARQRHNLYLELLQRCASSTGEPAVRAVAAFLGAQPWAQLERLPGFQPAKFDRKATITFVVDGTYPVDLPSVQAFWASENVPGEDVMQCVVCGATGRVWRRLPKRIKRIPGDDAADATIISANSDAFVSYGLEESLIAPTCPVCAEAFCNGLNDLLERHDSHIILGTRSVMVFWTRVEHPFSVFDVLDDPKPEQVKLLIEAARDGNKDIPEIDETGFYAAVLSRYKTRAVVRDWIDTTVAEMKRRLGFWFAAQAMVREDGSASLPQGFRQLAYASVPSKAKEPGKLISPVLARALWRAALTDTPLPLSLLSSGIQRNRAERKVTWQRAALIKLVLCTRVQDHPTRRKMEDSMTKLSLENTTPAYLCGRLLAVLERAQYLAVGEVSANIVDRFYGAASSAPATVFPTLMNRLRAHLSTLRKEKPGAHVSMQGQIEEILSGLPNFPRILTLEEQGLFALGYYHQRAHDRAQARDIAESRRARAAAEEAANEKEEEE